MMRDTTHYGNFQKIQANITKRKKFKNSAKKAHFLKSILAITLKFGDFDLMTQKNLRCNMGRT